MPGCVLLSALVVGLGCRPWLSALLSEVGYLAPEPEVLEPERLVADVPLPLVEVTGAVVPLPLVELAGAAVPLPFADVPGLVPLLEHAVKDSRVKHRSRPKLIENIVFMTFSLMNC